MKFSLVHPSRERAERCYQVISSYRQQMSKLHQLEIILSLDLDDPQVDKYYDLFRQHVDVKLEMNYNKTYVEALNNAARHAKGDVIIASADDFYFPDMWDCKLAEVIGEKIGREFVVWVADGVQPRIMTLPILSLAYYKKFGYIYYPEYISMYADNDYTEVAKKTTTVINAQHLQFRHMHYSLGHMPEDNTARRQNASSSYKFGEELFKKRMQCNFGL